MPLFTVQVFKEGYGEKWSNRYLIEASSLAAAVICAPAIATAERGVHLDTVLFTYMRVSDLVAANDNYATIPVNNTGQTNASASALPLFNTVRVDIDVEGFGRPSRKYYRLPLMETDQDNHALSGTLVSAMAAMVNAMIAAVDSAGGGDGELVDPDGQSWVTATTFPRVQMRQLHRKRRRAAPPA